MTEENNASPSFPVPAEQEHHKFLQFPLGRFRNPKDDIGKCWHVVNMLYCGLPADAEIHQPAATPAPVEQEQKAHYESAHEARYVMTHTVHPDIVVLWFLALKSHWFDDPNNMFHGMREQAKAYLYKWVETGELADDNTTLEIATAMKFREWLQSSWTTATPSPSLAVDVDVIEAAKAAHAWICRVSNQYMLGEDEPYEVLGRLNRAINAAPSPVPAAGGDEDQLETVGDGRYCRHHEDDPAHGAICYDKTLYEDTK